MVQIPILCSMYLPQMEIDWEVKEKKYVPKVKVQIIQ
jgi:hypothetical protein